MTTSLRVGLYARPVPGGWSEAVARGLRALGHTPVERRPSVFNAAGDVEAFDCVVVHGLRDGARRVRDSYAARGVPVLVVDWPRLRPPYVTAESRYDHYLGLGGVQWLPPVPCDPARLAARHVLPEPRVGYVEDGYVLVAGQTPRDCAHGMDEKQLRAWYARLGDELRATHAQPIVFRQHPADPAPVACPPWADRVSDPRAESAADALRGAYYVTSYNSTIGTEAILHGVPAMCEDPDAMYGAFRAVLTPERRLDYLARVAYTQWTLEELASGAALAFVLGFAVGAEVPAVMPADVPDAGAPDFTPAAVPDAGTVVPTPPTKPTRKRRSR